MYKAVEMYEQATRMCPLFAKYRYGSILGGIRDTRPTANGTFEQNSAQKGWFTQCHGIQLPTLPPLFLLL
jgi:hypothetical protein